jgi:hypothetical protein
VIGAERNKLTTIMKFVSRMIDDANNVCETLYTVKIGDCIKIVFKFIGSIDVNEGEQDVARGVEEARELKENAKTKMEGKISIVLRHGHPYLSEQVWLETNRHMEMTYLKGNYFL